MKTKLFSTRNLVTMSVYSALAIVLAFFPHIHIPALNPILEIEFSDVPVLIAAYYFHPVCALIVAAVKSLIHLSMTETFFVGEAFGFLQAAFMILPFFFFRKRKSRTDFSIKVILAFAVDLIFGLAASPTIVIPYLHMVGITVPGDFLLIVTLPYFAARAALICFLVYVLGMGVHNVFMLQHNDVFLTVRGAASAKRSIDLAKPFEAKTPKDTDRFAAALATTLHSGDVLELVGDLGAGKTTLTKGIGKAYGIAPDQILSPTFVLCRTYEGTIKIHHADLYRIGSAEEAVEAGILEHIGDGLFVVEWADPVRAYLPPHKVVTITKGEGNRRTFEVKDV